MRNEIKEILESFNEELATEPNTSNMGIPEHKFDVVTGEIIKKIIPQASTLISLLNNIAYPLDHFKQVSEGDDNIVNGNMAIDLANNPDYLRALAKEALELFKPESFKEVKIDDLVNQSKQK